MTTPRTNRRLDRIADAVPVAPAGVDDTEARRMFAEMFKVKPSEVDRLPLETWDAVYAALVDRLARDIASGDVWNEAGVLMAGRSVDTWAREVGLDLAEYEDPRDVDRGLYPGLRRGALWCALDSRAEELRAERRALKR